MPSYRLHYFPESGNSYKVGLMLRLCGQPFEPVWTDFGSGVTWTNEWRERVNQMGEIPVLEEDGRKLTQSAPILLRLADRYGRFGGQGDEEKFAILRWLFWDNHKLSGYVATYRYKRAFTPNPEPQELHFLKKRIEDFLSVLERRFEKNDFAVGRSLTIADLSMQSYLSYPKDEHGFDLPADYPATAAWLDRLAKTPDWIAAYDLLPGNRLKNHALAGQSVLQ
ncbi:glutathione S-transferase family protein [Bradyrhizobium sp. LHD-71]|uniref:glutathione S-transferase family protein n=1 Tax=Bradyrhizobium sp. LHD-71 TaxID=3072141 RepID=UPI00280D1F1D|nr:glutathione S-transferase family protein [Bradyrhizobium sp. LHD-71]MDQ8729269.1 glutathione S-transferase family protein [Bradyrhizobium sp. LHD-71]